MNSLKVSFFLFYSIINASLVQDSFFLTSNNLKSDLEAFTYTIQPFTTNHICIWHTNGDRMFHGNGPRVDATIQLDVRYNQEVWAVANVSMIETSGDGTAGSRRYEQLLFTADAGLKIKRIISDRSSVINYTDSDVQPDEIYQGHNDLVSKVIFIGDTVYNNDFNSPGVCNQQNPGFKIWFNRIVIELE